MYSVPWYTPVLSYYNNNKETSHMAAKKTRVDYYYYTVLVTIRYSIQCGTLLAFLGRDLNDGDVMTCIFL